MESQAAIPFNKPFIAGKELYYIAQAVTLGNLAGDGSFTQACSTLLQERLAIHKILLTPSCTAALEMAAILCDLQPGDEAILPSFTFVSTASAIARTGARPIFADVCPKTLNIHPDNIEAAITERTKAIFVVHYAGVACDMDAIMAIAAKHNLLVVEDAAQAVNSFYRGRALGSIGHLGCFSFHETKNYICGEGGALCINDDRFRERAEIIRDKGTNRQNFFRGLTDKYTWVDLGSSYVPSEICSAFLYGQLELMDEISARRRCIFETYQSALSSLTSLGVTLPYLSSDCSPNYHMFYLLMPTATQRDQLLAHLNGQGIKALFHYVPLHSSPMGRSLGYLPEMLPVTEDISSRLIRLPMFYQIQPYEQERVVRSILESLQA